MEKKEGKGDTKKNMYRVIYLLFADPITRDTSEGNTVVKNSQSTK